MSIEALFEKLKHPNPNLRSKAMWEIAETKDENTIPSSELPKTFLIPISLV